MTKTPQEVIAQATASGLLEGFGPTQPIKKEWRGRQTCKGPACLSRRPPQVSVSNQSQVAELLNSEVKANGSAPIAAQERTNSTHSLWGNTHLRAGSLRLSFIMEHYLWFSLSASLHFVVSHVTFVQNLVCCLSCPCCVVSVCSTFCCQLQ